MLLLRMREAEAQTRNNALEMEEKQGLLPHHLRDERLRLALGRGICTGTRQTELGSHYWVAATLALLCVSGRTLLVGIGFCMYRTSECLSRIYYNKICCVLYNIYVCLSIYVSVFLYLYVVGVYIDGEKRKYLTHG